MADDKENGERKRDPGVVDTVIETVSEGIETGVDAAVQFVRENTGLSGEAARDIEERERKIDERVRDQVK